MAKVHIRAATMQDADNLLKWKNDPTMRKYSIVTHEKIKKADHLKWLAKNLKGIYIIGDNYGDVRVSGNEVAIKLAPEHRGKGYGLDALRAMDARYDNLIAKIVDGNISSMRLFIKAKYRPVAHKVKNGIGYYIFQR